METKQLNAVKKPVKIVEKNIAVVMRKDEGAYNKEDLRDFDIVEFITCIGLVNERLLSDYLRNQSGYHNDIRDIIYANTRLLTTLITDPVDPWKIVTINLNIFKQQQEIWKTVFFDSKNAVAVVEPSKGDKRFTDPEWTENPYFNFIKQNYLLLEKFSDQILDETNVSPKVRRKLHFYIGQFLDAFSPSNFVLTNPEVLRLAIETKGKSLWQGLNNLVKDLEKGKITQTDESAFEVGKNLAITPGSIIFENELMQLIQYSPVTKKVFEEPVLIIPPWINKYYILDLQKETSFVNFLLEQGLSVYIISWRNPQEGEPKHTFDDYVEKGALKAIEVTQSISGSKKINALGYCLGGTLLGIASSILATKKKESPIGSVTFLAAMLDFTDIGPMGDVINAALVRKLERRELLKDGVLHGRNMETAFDLIRDKDLVWKYVVNNYLKGQKPEAFDVLYWTNDNSNLPADMYIYYMRNIIFENKLSQKNALHIANTPIDLGKIDCPAFVVAFKEDYISPAKTVFTTTELVSGPVEFIYGESGHVMGAINPPSKKKYGYYMDGKLGKGFEEWQKTAHYFKGSWWAVWVEKIKKLSGNQIPAPLKAGNAHYKVIEPAPGRYVMERD